MLVELGLVEQRYAAVKDVLDNDASVTDVDLSVPGPPWVDHAGGPEAQAR